MPPIVPRKRLRASSPDDGPATPKTKASATKGKAVAPPRKPTLFDDLDATSTPPSNGKPGSASRIIDDSDDYSSLTSLSDGEFEDVPLPQPKRQKVEPAVEPSDSEDEDLEFEDVHNFHFEVDDAEAPKADLELTLHTHPTISLENTYGKKGPTKLDRKRRITTHCVHVMFLMWHNAVRNSWLCDPEVQGLLLSHLTPGLWDEVDRWRRNSGLEVPEEPPPKKAPVSSRAKGKGKAKAAPAKPARDWDQAAKRLERGAVDLSHGDPLFRLMKALSSWWKKRFRVTAPGLRKRGYMSAERLGRLMTAYKTEDKNDPSRFGERIESLDQFRRCAQECSGSRDVGAQLFTALLRALGLEARMVANIQPVGYGWNKLEEADPEKQAPSTAGTSAAASSSVTPAVEDTPAQRKKSVSRPLRRKSAPVLEEEHSFELQADNSDDEVVEVMMATPRKAPVYDKDLEFPHYWTEVLSPVTHKYLPVDAMVKSVVATNRDLVESLEPRGAKADRARQVMAYAVGFSQDGTAKDVTVRYLKKQVFPGRTKGMRMPVEKMPVYNRNGKVKRYDEYDWFKAVMRGYGRGTKDRPITEVDEEEQATDLAPKEPQKKEVKEGEETLQYYKQSKEYVLERHLKREEAILPTAKPVKTFKNKGKTDEEPVYCRIDVVQVKSAETWHKQGRAPLPGEQPLKRVPYRAATTNRRRELADAEAASGHKPLQGLYSFDQTDWIIPDPIVDGVIPKNEYGNIDLFAQHMLPQGAAHVPYRGATRACKKLGVDYAEAVVDFEFGHRMAVPVIQGVVVAEEQRDRVMEEIARDEAERSRKEDEKRRKAALGMWRKMLLKMRVADRIEREYGHIKDDVGDFAGKKGGDGATVQADDEMGGGFLPEGYEVDDEEKEPHLRSGFFPVGDHEDGDDGDDGGLEVDYGGGFEVPSQAYPTPQSGLEAPAAEPAEDEPAQKKLRVAKPRAKKSKPVSSRRRRRRGQPSSDEDDEDDNDAYEESGEEYLG